MSQQQSGEKTEKATPKRKRDAREKGQVFKSTEVNSAFTLIVMFGMFSLFGHLVYENTSEMLTLMLSDSLIPETMSVSAVNAAFIVAIRYYLVILAPVFIAAFMCGLVFNLLQVGFLFSAKAIQPKFEKISPVSGFKRLFSVRTVVELFKSIIKITIIGILGYSAYKNEFSKLPELMNQGIFIASQQFIKIIISVAFKITIGLAIFAPIDYLYQWWKYNKDLKMTKQEIKDEYKLSEGDPQIKGKIRQKQRQMSSMRMIQAVEEADVIITNPTHYAIGLSYDDTKHDAPVVVTKGKDHLAQRIKERAKEVGVEMVENRPLAQSLYAYCDIGDKVPEDMYKAVAEILAYVYNLKKNMGRRK